MTLSEAWRALFDEPDVVEAFVRSCRSFASGRTPRELSDAVDGRDLPEGFAGALRLVARGDRRRAWSFAADVVPALASGQSTTEDVLATAHLFDDLEDAPTLAVRVGQEFRERRREQREAICSLLSALARGFDVRLVATRLTRAWLAHEHREDLPGVSEWRSTTRDSAPNGDVVDAALATVDPDGREVSILRAIADASGETLSYPELYATARVDESRVRQCVARLVDLGLVATFGPTSDRKAELLEAGRSFLSALTQQITLEDAVSETGQHHTQAVQHALGTAPPEDEDDAATADGAPYRTRYLGRPAQHAAAATAPDGGIALAKTPLPGEDDAKAAKTRLVTYDADRDEAVVSVRSTGALQYVVSVAMALASPRFIDDALPPNRLDAVDVPGPILRGARCIGALSDDALEDGQVLRDALVEWGEEIGDLTHDLKAGEYDDRDRLRSEIMKSAHGLAGSLVHLLDVADVDLVREIRVPAGLDRDHLEELAESVGVSAAIQSRYGHFAAYRQLFESRTDKRKKALTPDVDAEDPLGRLIGSFVFRGPDVHRLRSDLEDRVGNPRDVVDDAPEFGVRVPIQEPDRPAFATATTRVLAEKNLRPTRAAVSIMQAVTGSPYDAARALNQLSPEDTTRDVRPDELRYALSTLDAARILPDLPPTTGAIVAALLPVDERLSQTDLADAADVSTRSVRRTRDRLEALGLVDVDAAGYRLTLSFRTRDERTSPVTPNTPESFTDAVGDLLAAVLPPERYGDPEDDVAGHLFHPSDPWGPGREDTTLNPWIRLTAALTATERPNREVSVDVGPPLEQESLAGSLPPSGGNPLTSTT